MKKVKNSDLKEHNSSLKNVKRGKVKKHKQKKRVEDAVSKIKDVKLVQKANSNLESKNNGVGKVKNKSKSAKQVENQSFSEEQLKVTYKEMKKKNKPKGLKYKQDNVEPDTPSVEFTEVKIKKTGKKKVKKLKTKQKRESQEQNITPSDTTNGIKKLKELNTGPTNTVDATSSKVLTKKEKKAKKRQVTKEQNLVEKQSRDPAVEEATVFVGNLPVNTKRIQLIRLFKDFTPVNSIRLRSAGGNILFRHKQRKSAGSLNAYVILKNKETAEKAVSLNGIDFKGHHLRVTLAAKNTLNQEKEGAKRTVFVGNLKYSATEETIREIFSTCGEIEYVRCIRDGDKGCKGIAYVCFKKVDAVGLALELNKTIVDERPINVERFMVKKLGAKKEREAKANSEEKSKKGDKHKLNNVKGQEGKSKNKKPKKSEFRGVIVDSFKKNQKSKKKKSSAQMVQLAKKIAPKIKTK